MFIRLFFVAGLAAAILTWTSTALRLTTSRAAAFDPQVSVWISDDTPGGHPDITTTIDIPKGPPLLRTETLTPPGGSIHRWGDFVEGTVIGWIGGFSTIPGPDGQCNQRFLFNSVPLVEANPDPATFPAFLRELATGPHRVRYTADAPGTPLNIIIDQAEVNGEQRLRVTSYIGDPSRPAVGCTPFRSRILMYGELHATPLLPPVGTAPPNADPRVYEFKLISRDGEVAERSGTAIVRPGLQPRLEPGNIAWNAVPGAASQTLVGRATYTTTCPLIRRLVIRQQDRDLGQKLPPDATSAALPASPSAEYELAQMWAEVTAYDADGVLLARDSVDHTRDFKTCWYPPGQEPLLHVSPAAGSCTGAVTFTGERFPPGVNVEITMPHYGTDGGGPRVAVAPVAPDGTFSVTATLPDEGWRGSACFNATMFPEGNIAFAAYNADEPHVLAIFAGVSYTASIPPGWKPPPLVGPVTGAGPAAHHKQWSLVALLAIAGAVTIGGGILLGSATQEGRH